MDKVYNLHFRGRLIGKLQICREGLYYRIHCQCDLPGKEVYRLIAAGEKGEIDLGICLSENGRLIFERCIPSKCFQFELLHFELREHNSSNSEQFVAVHHNEAFPHISDLIRAKWCRRGNEVGVVIKC